LVAFAQSMVGWLPGGIAFVVLSTCAFFTAFTGASGVTIVALGGLLLPMLLDQKYPERFSLGLVTASGSIGLLFPPSLPIILYGLVAAVSIDQLFVAGALPGIVLVGILMVYATRVSAKANVPRIPFDLRTFFVASRNAIWEIPLPFLIVGGIYGGIFTAIEAAAITAFYVFVVEVFVYGDLKLTTDVPRVMKESMVLVGAILAILGVALGLTNYFVDQEIPQKLFEYVRASIDSKTTFLLILNGFLIIVGMMMDIFSAIIVVVPLIFLTNLEIGYITPPVGLNLFLSGLRFKKPIFTIVRAVLVFILLELIALGIITYIPDLSLWLVGALGTQ
jgi:tripartite ATP-independent transporter DctM subunit